MLRGCRHSRRRRLRPPTERWQPSVTFSSFRPPFVPEHGYLHPRPRTPASTPHPYTRTGPSIALVGCRGLTRRKRQEIAGIGECERRVTPRANPPSFRISEATSDFRIVHRG